MGNTFSAMDVKITTNDELTNWKLIAKRGIKKDEKCSSDTWDVLKNRKGKNSNTINEGEEFDFNNLHLSWKNIGETLKDIYNGKSLGRTLLFVLFTDLF